MDQEIKMLLDSFKEYRDLLIPVQSNLKDIVDTYESIHEDINKLNGTIGDSVQVKLNRIYDSMSSQAKKSDSLSQSIDAFLKSSDSYNSKISNAISSFEKMDEKLRVLDELEKDAREQLKKLDEIIEEKKVNYNVKELQKSLDSYNSNVQKVSDYINKDIAISLTNNSKEIESIRQENEKISARLEAQKSDIASLIQEFKTNNELLKKVVDSSDVNEAYIFDILDRWAEDRKVKIKK